MESQLESVKSFYDYLSETGKTTDIFSDYNYSKFKDDIVDKYSLLEPVEGGRKTSSETNLKTVY